jgi:hypothetical protein
MACLDWAGLLRAMEWITFSRHCFDYAVMACCDMVDVRPLEREREGEVRVE